MTTHRVETVGFAPEGAVFIMQREAPRIRPCDDKIRTIGMLSGNLFGMILADKRPVFVEDRDDVAFYAAVIEVLTNEGHWPYRVSPEFVSVADWASLQRESGGKGKVRKAVASLSTAGLGGLVSGLIDRDRGELERDGVRVLGRYAMENYLLDPVVIFAFLLDRGMAPAVDFEIWFGEEAKLIEKSGEELESVVDTVLQLFEPKVREHSGKEELGTDVVEVRYVSGVQVVVPAWLHSEQGHTLLHALTGITPAARDRSELIKAFKRARLVPEELLQILSAAIGCASAAGLSHQTTQSTTGSFGEAPSLPPEVSSTEGPA